MTIEFTGISKLQWYIDLITAANIHLPFTSIQTKKIKCDFEKFHYDVMAVAGRFLKSNTNRLTIEPSDNKIVLKLDE